MHGTSLHVAGTSTKAGNAVRLSLTDNLLENRSILIVRPIQLLAIFIEEYISRAAVIVPSGTNAIAALFDSWLST
ncbi:hypothetical protein D3C80_1136380 [compost metagenome]